ncbi:unnamed protein product [Pseudo-nitzschia multistriata]|uniref:UDENN domain-containing protein n=1 Tax=Pseudo-nitzschia multistriata TaxID=183589 RepID=A0A448ZR92_9STRA|nr:unnamed protein product [Pseudo-nitzschia multistriata]
MTACSPINVMGTTAKNSVPTHETEATPPAATSTNASTPSPPSPQPTPSENPAITPTAFNSSPPKLRRKVSVEESIDNAVSVQRLVEYFLVVSCKPRWEIYNSTAGHPVPANGNPGDVPKSPKRQGARFSPITTRPTAIADQGIQTSTSSSNTNTTISARETTGTEHAIHHALSTGKGIHGEEDDECREDPSLSIAETALPPPQPTETWNRTEGAEENIRLPDASELDNLHAFSPKVTARFPSEDHSDHPLNPMITQFCFSGGDVVHPSTEYKMPSAHHFVMTNDKGRKVYGTCLMIYEEYKPPKNAPWQQRCENIYPAWCGGTGIEVSVTTEENRLYIPKCLCILSIWPYVTAFREYLAQLYRLATSTDCMKAPIERYVMNLCSEIPAPPPGAFEVKMSILDSVIRFWSPPAKLPIAYVSLPYQTLFDCLDIDNILHLWYCLTMERKVLLLSSQQSILTVCSEILCSLLYPMKWSHLYVPLLPKFLCPILDAPVPYLCGVTRDDWFSVQKFVCDETIVVDLDRNSIIFGQRTAELPQVPGKKWLKLNHSLQDIAGHLFWRGRGLETEYDLLVRKKIDHSEFKEIAERKGEHFWKEKLATLDQAFNLQYTPDSEHVSNDTTDDGDGEEQNIWDRLQEAFLRFFVAVFKDYRKFIHVPDKSKLESQSTGPGDWLNWGQNHKFDRDGFIASQNSDYYYYLSELCSTQQFDDFITKRLYSPELPDIIFFDQSIDAKLNRSRLKLKKVHTPFLQSAKTHKQLETFVAVEPNTSNLRMEAPFMYDTWPDTFDASLFCHPRPIPGMITAEFDRQASLVKRLQLNCSPTFDKDSDLVDLYGSDYDYTPEGMSFTVFFFVYSAVIGREWQQYQLKRRELENTVLPPPSAEAIPLERVAEECESKDPSFEVQEGEKAVSASQPDYLSDLTMGVCGGVVCPGGERAAGDAMAYISDKNPCPDFTSDAQAAYDTLSNYVSSLDPTDGCRNSSLLDNDDAFAEYEEAREVSVAQLDLAFDALEMMETRGLNTDPDVFKSLMEACGRCGNTKRALALIEIMKRDGLVADNDVLIFFMASFAHCRPYEEASAFAPTESKMKAGRRGSDAYSQFLKKKMMVMRGDSEGNIYNMPIPSDEDSSLSDGLSDSGSEVSTEPVASSVFQMFAPHLKKAKTKKKRRRRKKKQLKNIPENLSDRIKKQLELGESLLEFLYPDISIDTFGDACPMCSNVMNEENIVSGWQQCNFQDFTTSCPQCSHRFVPRFKISCSSPDFEGSQGPGTPLYCEFLSPWVLRKELGHILGGTNSIDQILDPAWRSGRDIRATIWWNLIAMFKRYQLPFSFLLQGSFRNRLINPVPQD